MFYGLKFLVGIFLIVFITNVSAQNFADKKIALNDAEDKIEQSTWKKPVFSDKKHRYFTKKKESEQFSESLIPIPAEFDNKKSNRQAEEPTDYKLQRGEKEINFEFGISPFRPSHFLGPEEYDTEDRKLGLLTFRWGRVIGTKKTITYQYLFEASFVYSRRNEVENSAYISPTETPFEPPTIRAASYGVAVTPVVFRMYFFSKNRFKPFGQFGAGIMYTNDPMPLPNTSKFNFTGYFGGGAMYQIKRKQGISLAYRYYHISNFQIGDFNPGYDANTFSLGYSFFYGK